MRQDLLYFIPELILIGTMLTLLVTDFFLKSKTKAVYVVVSLAGLIAMMAMTACLSGHQPSASFFKGMVTFDPMASFFKYVFGLSGILGILLAHKVPEMDRVDTPSYYTLLVALVLGMSLLSMSNNLLMIYLALEMVSVLSYILTGSAHGVRRSSEAALKYVIYGGVASGIMAYGISLLYGLTGTLAVPEIASFLKANAVSRPVLFTSLLLMMAGFGYKVASFPFHMWCPDVYEGAPTPFTAFLSVGPKAAGFAILVRFFMTGFTQPESFVFVKPIGWILLMSTLSVATMTIGNLAALGQNNLKRLLAYSSIAHAGYMLMALTALNQESLSAILFYTVVYLLMNVGAFLVVIVVHKELGVEDISGYKGLGKRGGRGTYLAILMSIFLFSLTGIPPFAGFIGKFFLFGAVIRSGLYGLAIIGVINSAISLYYYVRVIKVMFFDEPSDTRALNFGVLSHAWVVSGLAFLTLYLGIFWSRLAEVASHSAKLHF